MPLIDNDRIQEIFLVLGDKLIPVNKKWWYALGIVLVLLIPIYYLAKFGFVQVSLRNYHTPVVTHSAIAAEPLQIIDKKIFPLSNNSYSGFVKIKNINLEWGVAAQGYTVQFKTLGGIVLTSVSGSTFILPASEKLIVFSRFTSQTKPDAIDVSLADSRFIRNPGVTVNYDLERVDVQNNPDGLLVSASIKNLMAFTVKEIDLPVAVYNNKNEIVAVNFTYISDVQSGETRSFKYPWPLQVSGAVRAEIIPEINVFNRNIFSSPAGVSPFTAP
jgi:hypothetical protein